VDRLAEVLGNVAAKALAGALQAGKSRRQALQEAADALQREDVVSDELWRDLDAYVAKTKSFEEHGSG
jgi:hypothetical protein